MRQNLPVTGRNLELPKDANILSTTSPQSHITYVNPDFIKISGFTAYFHERRSLNNFHRDRVITFEQIAE